jgi:hypothetical protein
MSVEMDKQKILDDRRKKNQQNLKDIKRELKEKQRNKIEENQQNNKTQQNSQISI